MNKRIFIFDLEGTLSYSKWRESWIPNYSQFELLFKYDPCNEKIANIARAVGADKQTVVILTGKMERGRNDVNVWLNRHNIPFTWIQMRANDDLRPSEVYKAEYLLRYSIDEIAMVFDDRKKIIDHLKRLGYPTFHVEGNEYE